MATNNNDNGKKFFVGALIAGAAGYLAGILTAPKSGKETRQDIKDNASQMRQDVLNKASELRAEADEAVSKAKDKASEITGSAKLEIEEAVARVKKESQKVKELATALKAGKAEDPNLSSAISDLNDAITSLKKYLNK